MDRVNRPLDKYVLLFWMLASISLVRFSHMTFREFIKDYFDFGRQRELVWVFQLKDYKLFLVAYSNTLRCFIIVLILTSLLLAC